MGREKTPELRSFVFPRNVDSHHELLGAQGFTACRGADPTWYRSLPGPGRPPGSPVRPGAVAATPGLIAGADLGRSA